MIEYADLVWSITQGYLIWNRFRVVVVVAVAVAAAAAAATGHISRALKPLAYYWTQSTVWSPGLLSTVLCDSV